MAGTPLRVAMVAGETSGDLLGARVIRALRQRHGEVEVRGVGGEHMQAAGLQSLHAMETLAVMGFVEPLLRLRALLRLRRELARDFAAWQPDYFIGIDAPDFNLGLARRLRDAGVPTVHLVSPSIWAWRAGRLRGIARAVDLMLCLFPFEVPLYRDAGVMARCVGHPLASELSPPDPVRREALRASFGLADAGPVLGVLPGSRAGEVAQLGPPFLATVAALRRERPDLQVLIPAAGEQRYVQLRKLIDAQVADATGVQLVHGRSREVMAAADALLLASGTATLEAALLGAPMVVAYRMHALSWALISRLVTTPHAALPNILSAAALVPEYLQGRAAPDALAPALRDLLDRPERAAAQREGFAAIRRELRVDFDTAVVEALDALAGQRA